MIGVFYLYPILDALRLAFTNASLIGREETYTTRSILAMLANPALGTVLRNTAVFTGASVIGQVLLGLAIALLVVRGERNRLPGMLALRTIVLTAWVIPGVANGIIWSMLFNEAPYGAINSALRLLDIPPVAWLSNPANAMISTIIANVWQGTAFSMIVLYAAIKSIDPVLYEAAAVDGARPWERLWFITLPQLRAALIVNAILVTIQTLNTFDAIISLTGGGPGRATEVLSLFTYNTVFYSYDLAGGSALSMLMLLISLGLACVYALFLPRPEAIR
ncbi:sugar ABC transporter permease [Arsenicitalea aurantiaca]|uniref:Sugar ABC transporter permease n=1 Tax=Arsenicitalea aurantiaca TaxID=1783274 RepID=A0A433X3L5_9HYPH|nr:sugar ABC transporter permease [Arsenicitalea aurantiaca]RUT28631.1 sugar ABC transporter permease [Arsenicitalea aurantiaca]